MPDLSGDSEYRQCDVVIWQGKPPRETISIVEVQDRNSSINVNTFDGFVSKMRKVGAQHLIIVTRKEYPQSVKNAAIKLGPSIRLINLNELNMNTFPIPSYLIHESRTLVNIKSPHFGTDKELQDILQGKEVNVMRSTFEYKNIETSLSNLIYYYIDSNMIKCTVGLNEIKVKITKDKGLYVYHDGIKYNASVKFDAVIDYKIDRIPFSFYEYKQINHEDPLLWYAEASSEINGNYVTIKLSFKYDTKTGGYLARVEQIDNAFSDKYSINQD